MIYHISSVKSRTGSGRISACGGDGFGGGGGGRVSVDIFSRHDEPKIAVHGMWLKNLLSMIGIFLPPWLKYRERVICHLLRIIFSLFYHYLYLLSDA